MKYTLDDIIAENRQIAVYVKKADPCYDKFIDFLTNNGFKWRTGDNPGDLIYNGRYYILNKDLKLSYRNKNEIHTNNVFVINMDEIDYNEGGEQIDIDMSIFF